MKFLTARVRAARHRRRRSLRAGGGTDLNGDTPPDARDVVIQVFDVCTGAVTVVGTVDGDGDPFASDEGDGKGRHLRRARAAASRRSAAPATTQRAVPDRRVLRRRHLQARPSHLRDRPRLPAARPVRDRRRRRRSSPRAPTPTATASRTISTTVPTRRTRTRGHRRRRRGRRLRSRLPDVSRAPTATPTSTGAARRPQARSPRRPTRTPSRPHHRRRPRPTRRRRRRPPTPGALDRFHCYGVRAPRGAPRDVTLVDRFGATTVGVGEPRRVCNPANVAGIRPDRARAPGPFPRLSHSAERPLVTLPRRQKIDEPVRHHQRRPRPARAAARAERQEPDRAAAAARSGHRRPLPVLPHRPRPHAREGHPRRRPARVARRST